MTGKTKESADFQEQLMMLQSLVDSVKNIDATEKRQATVQKSLDDKLKAAQVKEDRASKLADELRQERERLSLEAEKSLSKQRAELESKIQAYRDRDADYNSKWTDLQHSQTTIATEKQRHATLMEEEQANLKKEQELVTTSRS